MKRSDVVEVDWQYTDLTGSKVRPAIVLQADFLNGLIDDTILVQIRVELTPTFTYGDAKHVAQDLAGELNRHLDPEDFWRALPITIAQVNDAHEQKTFDPFDVHADPIYAGTGVAGGEYIGTIVTLEYEASQFDSIPARIEMITNTGQHVVTDFDLVALR